VRGGDGGPPQPSFQSAGRRIYKNWLELTIDLDYQSHLYCSHSYRVKVWKEGVINP
jgi:hypothetical protein